MEECIFVLAISGTGWYLFYSYMTYKQKKEKERLDKKFRGIQEDAFLALYDGYDDLERSANVNNITMSDSEEA